MVLPAAVRGPVAARQGRVLLQFWVAAARRLGGQALLFLVVLALLSSFVMFWAGGLGRACN